MTRQDGVMKLKPLDFLTSRHRVSKVVSLSLGVVKQSCLTS